METDTCPGDEPTSVQECWQRLIDAGLPLGPAQPRRSSASPAALAAAIRTILSQPCLPTGADLEALAAFLRAWKHHWPSSFEAVLGADGDRWERDLSERAPDAGRLIRLKQIAVAHLARLL